MLSFIETGLDQTFGRRAKLKPEVMVAEANHRIANNLAAVAGVLRLHAADVARRAVALPAHEVCRLLEEIGGRIDTAGQLHRLLAGNAGDEAIDLGEYLRKISTAVVASGSLGDRAVLRHQLEDGCMISSEQALPVGLIVGEMVTNSLKYAHPTGVRGILVVCCERSETGIVIEVADDGVGMPVDFDPLTARSLGLRLIRSLAEQLDAELTFDQEGLGLSVRLEIPQR